MRRETRRLQSEDPKTLSSKMDPGTVHVVRDQDRGVGATKATNTGFDGVLTWRYRARNMRDFDWG